MFCGQEGECVSVATEDCRAAIVPIGAVENIVFIGSIIPTMPPFDDFGVPLERAVQLAIEDFNSAGGLPGGRKIGWVACDSRGSTTVAQRAATHLVEVVGVPAIIGPVMSTPFIDVTTNITAKADVITISPAATSPAITGLDDKNLAWRTIASDVFQGNAILDRIIDLGVAKVVVLSKQDAYGTGLSAAIGPALTAELGDENVHLSTYEDPVVLGGDPAAIADEFSARAAAAIADMPDAELIALLGTTEAIDLLKVYLMGLESAGLFPPAPGGTPPHILFPHGVVPSLGRAVDETNDILIGAVEGVSPNIFDPVNFAAFNLRYRARFQVEETITSTSLSFDATMVVLFAMSALAPDAPITGPDIVTGIAKLVDKSDDGVVVSFGDTNTFIALGRNTLAEGGSVDLIGVSGEIDFDISTGDVRTDYVGWGVEKVDGDYILKMLRIYSLDAEPAESGTWAEYAP